MRRGFVVLLLAASLGLGTGPSSAAPPQSLVLRGSRSASTVVDFKKPVTFHMYDNNDMYAQGVSATLRGTYAGISVRRMDGRLVFARFVVKGFEATAFKYPVRHVVLLGDLHENVVIQPGRYRVSLLTDGPSELRIRTKGLPATRVLVPSGPAERIRAQRLDLRTGGVAPVGYGKAEDVDVRDSSYAALATFSEYTDASFEDVTYCFTNQPDCEVGSNGGGGSWIGIGITGSSQTGYDDSWVRPGRWDVLFRVVGGGVPLVMSGFFVVLD